MPPPAATVERQSSALEGRKKREPCGRGSKALWPGVIAGVMYQEGGTEESTTRFELLVLIYTPCPRHAHAMHTPCTRLKIAVADTQIRRRAQFFCAEPRTTIEHRRAYRPPYARGPRARHLSAACACRSSSLSASPTLSSSRHRCSHSRAAALSLSLAWQSPAKSAAFLLAFSA